MDEQKYKEKTKTAWKDRMTAEQVAGKCVCAIRLIEDIELIEVVTHRYKFVP